MPYRWMSELSSTVELMDYVSAIGLLISVASFGFAAVAFARSGESDAVTWQWGLGRDRSVWFSNIGFDTARKVRITVQFADFYGRREAEDVLPAQTVRCGIRMLRALEDDDAVRDAVLASCGKKATAVEIAVHWKTKWRKPRVQRFEMQIDAEALSDALTGSRRKPVAIAGPRGTT